MAAGRKKTVELSTVQLTDVRLEMRAEGLTAQVFYILRDDSGMVARRGQLEFPIVERETLGAFYGGLVGMVEAAEGMT